MRLFARFAVPLLAMMTCSTEVFAEPATSPYTVTRLTQNDSRNPAWSPDGTRIVYVSNGGLSVLNLEGGDPTPLFGSGGNPSWSPAGDRVLFRRWDASPYALWVISSAGGTPAPLSPQVSPTVMRWSPDGKYVAVLSWISNHFYGIRLFPFSGGKPDTLSTTWDSNDFDWAPDSQSLLCVRQGGLSVFPISGEAGTEIAQVTGYSPRWSPDGSTIALSDQAGIWILPATGGTPTLVWERTEWWFSDLNTSWSPDSRKIVFDSIHEGSFQLYLLDLDTPVPVRPITWGKLKQTYD